MERPLKAPEPDAVCLFCGHTEDCHGLGSDRNPFHKCTAWVEENRPFHNHGCGCPKFVTEEIEALRQYIREVHHVVEPLVGLLRLRSPSEEKLRERADRAAAALTASDTLMAVIRGTR